MLSEASHSISSTLPYDKQQGRNGRSDKEGEGKDGDLGKSNDNSAESQGEPELCHGRS
jgi:hypothetical protein